MVGPRGDRLQNPTAFQGLVTGRSLSRIFRNQGKLINELRRPKGGVPRKVGAEGQVTKVVLKGSDGPGVVLRDQPTSLSFLFGLGLGFCLALGRLFSICWERSCATRPSTSLGLILEPFLSPFFSDYLHCNRVIQFRHGGQRFVTVGAGLAKTPDMAGSVPTDRGLGFRILWGLSN